VSGGTFHSFANQVLRRYSKHIGFTENFTIFDRKDSEDIIGIVRNRMGFFRSKKKISPEGHHFRNTGANQ